MTHSQPLVVKCEVHKFLLVVTRFFRRRDGGTFPKSKLHQRYTVYLTCLTLKNLRGYNRFPGKRSMFISFKDPYKCHMQNSHARLKFHSNFGNRVGRKPMGSIWVPPNAGH